MSRPLLDESTDEAHVSLRTKTNKGVCKESHLVEVRPFSNPPPPKKKQGQSPKRSTHTFAQLTSGLGPSPPGPCLVLGCGGMEPNQGMRELTCVASQVHHHLSLDNPMDQATKHPAATSASLFRITTCSTRCICTSKGLSHLTLEAAPGVGPDVHFFDPSCLCKIFEFENCTEIAPWNESG
jgi:hypothetical protein